jgi:hypothetical protein
MNGVNSACQGGQRDPLQESWKCTAVLRPILALVPLDLQCVALCSKVFTMPRNLKRFQMTPSEHDVIKTGRCVLCRRFVFETPMPVGRLVRQVADKHQVSWSNRATAYFLQGDATGNLTLTCSRLLNEMCRPSSPLGLGLIVDTDPSPAMCHTMNYLAVAFADIVYCAARGQLTHMSVDLSCCLLWDVLRSGVYPAVLEAAFWCRPSGGRL